MTTLAEHIIIAGAENRPPMLEKSMYDSWASHIRLFIKGKKHGGMMLDSIDNATNIILHGLPPDVYALVNHQEATNDIWDRVKMLMKGTELSYQECECRLYNLFDKFSYVLGETLMTMQQVQVNTKFLNALPSEWSKFVNDVKLAKSLYTTNYDQLYAYLSQHERHANEVRITRERYPDPLAFVANSPTLYNPSQSPQHSGEDPIECINKAMAFLSAVASRFPPSNNQIRTLSNPRNQATIQDGEGHMARQCTQPKRPRNVAWFKEKSMLAEAQEAGQILDEEQLAFLADPGISKVPDVQEMQYSEQTRIDDFQDNEIHSDSNIIPYFQYLHESQNAVIQDTNPSAPNDLLVLSLVEQMTDHVAHLDKENQTNKMGKINRFSNGDLIRDRNAKLAAFQQEIDTLKETLSNNVKEKESLSKTLTVFKTESKEKESKYIDNEIVLGKQNKELETQRIQPTLYDGSVIAKEHAVISVIDDEETLILEEESRPKMLDKQNDPISIEKKIKISPINYSKFYKIKEDFGKRFVTQKELSTEEAFWLKHSSLSETPIKSHTPIRIEAPSELPKVSLVNESLKKLKYQLANFDKVVKQSDS
ncbi:hypothetical protein Tco_1402843 [Tanacetum coccineum]